MSRTARPLRPRPSRIIINTLALAFVLPLGALLILRALGAPLGQGYFQYRYSLIPHLRAPRLFPLVFITAAIVAALYLLAHRRRKTGILIAILTLVATTVWIWWAPPAPVHQQSFNLRSPSHDGAF